MGGTRAGETGAELKNMGNCLRVGSTFRAVGGFAGVEMGSVGSQGCIAGDKMDESGQSQAGASSSTTDGRGEAFLRGGQGGLGIIGSDGQRYANALAMRTWQLA